MVGVHDGLSRTVTVVANQRIVDTKDIASILRQSGLTRFEFEHLVDM
jgi:hypothetical protein